MFKTLTVNVFCLRTRGRRGSCRICKEKLVKVPMRSEAAQCRRQPLQKMFQRTKLRPLSNYVMTQCDVYVTNRSDEQIISFNITERGQKCSTHAICFSQQNSLTHFKYLIHNPISVLSHQGLQCVNIGYLLMMSCMYCDWSTRNS